MPGRIDFTMGFNATTATKITNGDSTYRVYILGNFSGRAEVAWEQRKIRKIDIDNFEQVMTQIMPTLEIAPGSILQFTSLEDFHPDVWLEKIKLLADLRALKTELSNPNSAAQAAAKIQAYFPSTTPNSLVLQAPVATESQDDMLERLLGKKPEDNVAVADSLDRLLNQIVLPHISQDVAPQHRALIEVIDAAIGQFVKTLLHRPEFQNLEALWRATIGLVQEESADQQQIFLLDISQADLLTALKNGNDNLLQKLRQHIQTSDGEQKVLLIGDYALSANADDKTLLKLCSQLAHACDAYFLAGAGKSLVSAALENPQNWLEYRREIHADSVMLAYPRMLMRLPYGKQRDPLTTLSFEECSLIPQSDELLWGNPAFLCARVLIKSEQGQATPDQLFFTDVAAFSYELDGESLLQPGTEVILNETQAHALLSLGIMPVIGFRQRQGIRLLALATCKP